MEEISDIATSSSGFYSGVSFSGMIRHVVVLEKYVHHHNIHGQDYKIIIVETVTKIKICLLYRVLLGSNCTKRECLGTIRLV